MHCDNIYINFLIFMYLHIWLQALASVWLEGTVQMKAMLRYTTVDSGEVCVVIYLHLDLKRLPQSALTLVITLYE